MLSRHVSKQGFNNLAEVGHRQVSETVWSWSCHIAAGVHFLPKPYLMSLLELDPRLCNFSFLMLHIYLQSLENGLPCKIESMVMISQGLL